MSAPLFLTQSPVRIYVLWHPDFDRPELKGRPPASLTATEKWQRNAGLRLARRIYHWFRLENMEGIPVYFRSANGPGGHQPIEIPDVGGTNYIIPLVDANMVASPEWRGYARGLAERAKADEGGRDILLPVAVDPVAYNMPAGLREINFIRHDMSGDDEPEPDALLSRLTEIICRDLRAFLSHQKRKETGNRKVKGKTEKPGQPPPEVPVKLKVFLSHAKADGTKEALALKDYLYRKTQCEAFFDETDIASGYDFAAILGGAVEKESAGLFVIQGDHYADRPWCRKEIRDFLEPVPDTCSNPDATAFFVPPVVVVQTMKGERVARSIPELGHAPCVGWKDENSARFMVTTLLREILLGLFYRLLSRDLAAANGTDKFVFVNRTPDPVMVDRIRAKIDRKLADEKRGDASRPDTFAHPGYGLSAMDRMCLTAAFPELKFISFSEISDKAPVRIPDLGGAVIAVSAGNSPDILSGGAADEHNQELLRRLLRPMFRAGASVLYGGALPTADCPAEPWEKDVNFTTTFLELLLSGRDSDGDGHSSQSRLYNLSAWPFSGDVTCRVRAQWTDICSFIPVGADRAKLGEPPEIPAAPAAAELEELRPARRAAALKKHAAAVAETKAVRDVIQARCLSAMRKMAATNVVGPILPDWSNEAKPPPAFLSAAAHIFLGGKIDGSAGIMPGIFEEALQAFEAEKPVFLIGAGYGAAGLLARCLTAKSGKRPPELTAGFYAGNPRFAETRRRLIELQQSPLGKQHDFLTPDEGFDMLWERIQQAKSGGLAALMHNKLSDEQNRLLLTSKNYAEICELVWAGISKLRTPATP